MSRLIDADKILEKLQKMIEYCNKDKCVNGLNALFQVGDAIMDCPTVDAVEVVRCRDCVSYIYSGNYIDDDGAEKEYWYCDFHSLPNNCVQMQPNSFCSYGEKRDE